MEPKKILILHGGALGDLVLFVPTLRRLRQRFPQSELVLLGSPYSGSVLEGLSYLDRLVLTYRKTDGLGRYLANLFKLRREGFDLLIDVHSTSRSRQQKLIVGAKQSIGMTRGDRSDRLYDATVPRNHDGHMIGEYSGLLTYLGISAEEKDMNLELPVSDSHRRTAARLLTEYEVKRPFAVIQATTSGRPEYEVWASERFAQICGFLGDRGIASVASSDSRGGSLIDEIAGLAKAPVANLAGKTSPLELAAVLERASLYFGYNTGPMHIASATNSPTVALFERPKKYRPWHPLSDSWEVLMPSEITKDNRAVYAAKTISVEEAKRAIEKVLQLPF